MIHVLFHDDVIKWTHFPRNWPFVQEIHRSPVNFPHKGQWRGPLMFSLIYAWINDWVNNREAGDLRRQHGHYDVIVMLNWDKRNTDQQHKCLISLCIYSATVFVSPFTVLLTITTYFLQLPSSNCQIRISKLYTHIYIYIYGYDFV